MVIENLPNKVRIIGERIRNFFLTNKKRSLISRILGLSVLVLAVAAGVFFTIRPKITEKSKAAEEITSAMATYGLSREEAQKITAQVNEIKKTNPSWTPGITDMAINVMRDPNYFKGLDLDKIQKLDQEKKSSTSTKVFTQSVQGAAPGNALPTNFDWRNRNGKNYMTSAKSQGGCGSCWDFAAVGAVEGAFNAYYNRPNLVNDLSEQDILNCFGGCNGGGPIFALGYIESRGVVTEKCRPYNYTSDKQCLEGASRCPGDGGQVDKNLYKITDWDYEDGQISFSQYPSTKLYDTNKVKHAIMNYGPLAGCMNIYNDFLYYKSGIYEQLSEKGVGGHCIVWVGWGNENGIEYFIGKNSWGTNWGEAGYFKMKIPQGSGLHFAGDFIMHPLLPQSVNALCTDDDKDGYCVWGLGPKPSSGCPTSCQSNQVQDCNDVDSNSKGECWITPRPAPSPFEFKIISPPSHSQFYVGQEVTVKWTSGMLGMKYTLYVHGNKELSKVDAGYSTSAIFKVINEDTEYFWIEVIGSKDGYYVTDNLIYYLCPNCLKSNRCTKCVSPSPTPTSKPTKTPTPKPTPTKTPTPKPTPTKTPTPKPGSLPDLVVTNITRSSDYQVTYCNKGTGEAKSSYTAILVFNKANWRGVEWSVVVPKPSNCSSINISCPSLDMGDTSCKGQIKVEATIDSKKTINESNENNNTFTKSFGTPTSKPTPTRTPTPKPKTPTPTPKPTKTPTPTPKPTDPADFPKTQCMIGTYYSLSTLVKKGDLSDLSSGWSYFQIASIAETVWAKAIDERQNLVSSIKFRIKWPNGRIQSFQQSGGYLGVAVPTKGTTTITAYKPNVCKGTDAIITIF